MSTPDFFRSRLDAMIDIRNDMKVRTMTKMWTLLDAYTLDSDGRERPVNNLNEWGGFSRRIEHGSSESLVGATTSPTCSTSQLRACSGCVSNRGAKP